MKDKTIVPGTEFSIVSATAEYTGGGIYIFHGKLSDGNYFRTCDDWDSIEITNSDTSVEAADYQEFYDEHTVETVTGEKYESFWNTMLTKIITEAPKGNYSVGELENRLIKPNKNICQEKIESSNDKVFEIRRADMENLQEYRIWKHANEDVWEKCGEHFGSGTDALVLVDVKDIREFDYKGEHFKIFIPPNYEDRFSKEEFFEPIGKIGKVVYHRFTEKDFVNVVMKEDLEKNKEGSKMDRKNFLKLCLEEKNKFPKEGIKEWEYAIQQAIEKVCSGKQWYEVTKVSIFNELLSGKIPVDVCEMVWNDVVQELSLKNRKKDSLEEKISQAEEKSVCKVIGKQSDIVR